MNNIRARAAMGRVAMAREDECGHHRSAGRLGHSGRGIVPPEHTVFSAYGRRRHNNITTKIMEATIKTNNNNNNNNTGVETTLLNVCTTIRTYADGPSPGGIVSVSRQLARTTAVSFPDRCNTVESKNSSYYNTARRGVGGVVLE